jgi:sigma-B regulation protein RsbU (phosphoserine phosphatase)
VVALRAQAERSAAIDVDLTKARDRQRRLLRAAPPDSAGVSFGLLYRPAERVGGDFYDFVPLGEDRFGLVVGDVSGHGIEGAILMGMAKKVCALRLAETGDPAEALRRANEDLRPDLDGVTFVTALAAVVDLGARHLVVARAGHNPAMLANPSRTPAVKELDPPGMVLGMAEGARFDALLSHAEEDLASGDLILVYSDGITECENPLGMEFGSERLADFLARAGDPPPQALLDTLYQRLVDFQGGADRRGDDCTAIALRIG